MAQPAPVRQLVFAAGLIFACLALATTLLRPKVRLAVLALLVFVFCVIFWWLQRSAR